MARIFKLRYFPTFHISKEVKGHSPSFIWSGICTAKEEILKGFRWVLGKGNEIVATKDPWLRRKSNFCVDNNLIYEERSEKVSSLFVAGRKEWNENLVK